jgi:cell surface protein SprA
MVLKVMNLDDGDARAAFKNVNLDIRQYRKLRMEVHAEAMIGQPLKDGDLTAFIRIGTDYKGNFYEYELPLKLTPPGHYNNDKDEERAKVWPAENSFDIDLSLLQAAKEERNRQMLLPGSSLSISDVFVYTNGTARISVSGNPNMSNLKVIMIGVRNPIKTRNKATDDGSPKYGEVWFDELRLNDFIENGGWAANGHMQARLADLGTVDMVGQFSTPGWGSIDSKVNDRSKNQTLKYDISSNIELGKFFPEKIGVRLPVYVGYSETRIKPQYDPLDPDILLNDALKTTKNQAARDSILSISEDYSRRKTITISNAGITKRGKTPHPWDPANLSVNYTYNEIYSSNTTTEINLQKNYRGGINYDFQAQPANIMPFKSVSFLNSPIFKIIKDFNFYPYPKSISFRTDLSRDYNELITRDINNPYLKITPSFKKDFEWSRMYDFKYDITRNLKFDFTATNLSRIDEPPGGVDKSRYSSIYKEWRDSVLVNLRRGGRTTDYNHFMNVTYTLPVNKLPLLSWLNANARYSADYTWLAGPLFPDSLKINLGNSIKNHSELSFTAMANLSSLYTKLKFLKRIENNTMPGAAQKIKADLKTVTFTKDNVSFKPNVVKAIYHNLKTKDIKVKIVKKNGEEVKGKLEIVNDNKINFTAAQEADGAKVIIEGKVKVPRNPLIVTGEYLVRAVMGIRSLSLTYTTSQGEYLPGYTPETKFLGMSTVNNKLAPGWPFILGYSNKSYFDKALSNGWISKDTIQNTPAMFNSSISLSLRSLIEPFPGLRIDVNADRRYQEAVSSYYVADVNGNFPDSTRNRMVTGNYSISIISWGTAFEKLSKNNDYASAAFETFKNNIVIISARRAAQRQKTDPGYNPDIDPVTGNAVTGPYKSGYGQTSSEVLIPAFIAAYTKTNPGNVGLETFPSALKMMPNWRITFDGLSKFDFVQTVFRSISLTHQYRSTYQIGSFSTNLNYRLDENGINSIRDLQNNFIQQYQIDVATISEQFSPLINVDMNWKNSLTTRFEWRKSRTVTLNLTSNQVADARINELIFGAGYRFDNVQIILKTGAGQRKLKSDLNLRFDLSIRDDKTIARKLVEDVDQPVIGQRVFTLGTTADYVLSDKFNLQIFVDRTMNNPFVATTFPTSNTNFGFSLKFTLVQ